MTSVQKSSARSAGMGPPRVRDQSSPCFSFRDGRRLAESWSAASKNRSRPPRPPRHAISETVFLIDVSALLTEKVKFRITTCDSFVHLFRLFATLGTRFWADSA